MGFSFQLLFRKIFFFIIEKIIRAFCHDLPSIYLFLQVEGKCKQDFLGAPGVMGVQGDVGPRGALGPKGIRGVRGPKGFSYITEPVPLVGPKGIKGNPGK